MTHHTITYFIGLCSVYILRDVCPICISRLIPLFNIFLVQVMSPRRHCAPVQTVEEGHRPSLVPRRTAAELRE